MIFDTAHLSVEKTLNETLERPCIWLHELHPTLAYWLKGRDPARVTNSFEFNADMLVHILKDQG